MNRKPGSRTGGETKVEYVTRSEDVVRSGVCPIRQTRERLREAGLVPTRQRVSIGWLLFGKGDRHVTADMLYAELRKQRFPLSQATVYNTLTQFKNANLVREIATFGGKTWYDTNVGPHHHYFSEDDRTMFDLPDGAMALSQTPPVPEGMELVGVDVVVRVRRKAPSGREAQDRQLHAPEDGPGAKRRKPLALAHSRLV